MNIIIDSAFLLHQTHFVLSSMHKESANIKELYSTQKDIDDFLFKFITDMNKMVNYPRSIKRIIVCQESHSWRKDCNIDYKANRKKDDNDKEKWDTIYKVWNRTIDLLSDVARENGIFMSKLEQCEGDDLIHFWCQYFHKKNLPCLLPIL